MTRFYSIRHNTSHNRGVPEIYEIVEGLTDSGTCPKCGASRRQPSGDLRVCLGRSVAKNWPDVVACGDFPCFVVSQHFVDSMSQCGIRLELGGKVEFMEPIENGLSLENAPRYYWIDGSKHFGATMYFEASGFVDVRFCDLCGNRSEDVGLSYDRQHSVPPPPFTFDYNACSGLDLFTTDLASTAFFCTERVLNCAKDNRLSNLRFSAVEQGVLGVPVKY
jgi:hypothetical protein